VWSSRVASDGAEMGLRVPEQATAVSAEVAQAGSSLRCRHRAVTIKM
jgi:hypothetical protein